MKRTFYGTTRSGEAVEAITLESGAASCTILTYGATLQSLTVPGRDGKPVDVVLGLGSLEHYEDNPDKCLGATVGRHANRIAGASFSLNGVEYPLAANNGPNNLHGGPTNFSTRVWKAEEVPGGVRFTYVSPHMEEGFPGTLTAQVTYLLEGTTLTLQYRAVSDRDTLCSLTNHSYFNLSGHASGSVLDHVLTLHAETYTPSDAAAIPTGEIAPVENTPMDFRTPATLGSRIDEPFQQLLWGKGYDHNYVVDGPVGTLRPAAELASPKTGIVMEVETTSPGVQLYTGNYLDGRPSGKDGVRYQPRDGVCLETQFFPDAIHHANFPQPVLRAGEVWAHTTVFRFSVRP